MHDPRCAGRQLQNLCTCAELARFDAETEEKEILGKVREIHAPGTDGRCQACRHPWPCATHILAELD